ncbi:MAG: hypothetical protein M3275_11785, partial [Thermoproteota archaeon]|nr:hypothetical protein [Thermoproteota archaeon]
KAYSYLAAFLFFFLELNHFVLGPQHSRRFGSYLGTQSNDITVIQGTFYFFRLDARNLTK